MKYLLAIVIAILTLLATSSGISKIILMQQDVDFFGKYGFSDPVLMLYGAIQVLGGILLPFKRTRFPGAAVVAATFMVSLLFLLLEGNIAVSIITAIAMVFLGFVMMKSRAITVDS